MSKIIYLSNVDRRFAMMKLALTQLQEEGLVSAASAIVKVEDNTQWSDKLATTLQDADFVMLKWMGGSIETPFFKQFFGCLDKHQVKYYVDAAGADTPEVSSGVGVDIVKKIKEYTLYNGLQNYRNLLLYAQYLCDGVTSYQEPDVLYWAGIFHPRADKVYTDLTEYRRDFCPGDKPNIGVLFYRDEWIWGDLTYQTALINEIEAQGMNAICVFSNGMPVQEMGMPTLVEVFKQYFAPEVGCCADVIINTMKFSLTNSRTLTGAYLQEQNILCLQAYTLLTEFQEWEHNLEGMNPMEISISVTMPEFDGAIHGVPIATKKILEDGDVSYLPIQERLVHMVNKARKWSVLRHKANQDKRVAIVFHNYPPKNSNIGSAVGLDTIESIRLVLDELRSKGYTVGAVPADGEEFIKLLTHNATNDRSALTDRQLQEANKISDKAYQDFLATKPSSVQEQMTKDWGEAPGEVMHYDGNLLVPGTMTGNVFITVQPPRGFGEAPEKIYHSPFTAPTHQYIAFYQWIRDIWQADAVIHVGTHGSLEWLPGKNAGMNNTCFPDLALGDIPNIYPYLITITGEGIQAKRRGSACLIEHLPPPQTQAGVYDELEEVEKLMDEYTHFVTTERENAATLQDMLLAKVTEANLQDEVTYDETQPFGDYVLALHNYITDLKNMQVHTGLHILGQAPCGEHLLEYLELLTRLPNGDVPSLLEAVARARGYEYYYLLEHAGEVDAATNHTNGQLIDEILLEVKEIILDLQKANFTVEHVQEILKSSSTRTEEVCQAASYLCTNIYPNLMLTTQELTNLLRALEGEYIEPGPSGAPSSGCADLLPTGRNFYGVDPRCLPTPAAWELGKTLGEQAIERFIAEEGRYPESVGIVLWSGANMRSHGQCIAEFLYLMGLRPVWMKGSQRVIDLEIMPLTELKRPRIDVTGRISGLFRDTMPTVMELMDQAVLQVGELDEDIEDNFVRKHILEDSQELIQDGMSQEDAWRQASFRVFGDELGVYGAGVAALLESKKWETIDDIADVYVRWGAHAYGGKTRGAFLPQIFRKRMSTIDITIKNEDNHETNMLSSDDYNAYHGGMIAAVRSIKGTAPKSYCGDSTNKARLELHSVQEEAKRIFRSESINPKFIHGMMEHGYKGAADMANMVAHSFQWDATSAVMEDWMYEKYAEKYAFAPEVQEWMQKVNPWALQRIAEVLLEAEQRGMWQAKAETKEELQKLYLSIEGELEERSDD